MHWILTGMLIVASAATAGFTGYLVRRLFTLEPGAPTTGTEPEPATPPAAPQPASQE